MGRNHLGSKGVIEMQKKMMLGVSLALVTALVTGGIAVGAGSDDNKANNLTQKMCHAMNTKGVQEMVKACTKFMESYS